MQIVRRARRHTAGSLCANKAERPATAERKRPGLRLGQTLEPRIVALKLGPDAVSQGRRHREPKAASRRRGGAAFVFGAARLVVPHDDRARDLGLLLVELDLQGAQRGLALVDHAAALVGGLANLVSASSGLVLEWRCARTARPG